MSRFVLIAIAVLAIALAFGLMGAGAQRAYAADGSPSVDVTRAVTGKLVMKKGSTYKLAAKASAGKLTYKSSKKKVVAVSKKGVLKARKTGKAVVTVTAKKGSRKAVKKVKITVVKASKFKKVKKLSAKVSAFSLEVGQTTKVNVAFNPKNASNRNVTYKSSDPSVAGVSATGVVTAKKAGTAKITVASCDNKKAKATLKVSVRAANLNPAVGTLEVDEKNHVRGRAGNAVFTVEVKNSTAASLTDGSFAYEMHDDGEGGDEKAGDGVFTYSYDTSALRNQETRFRAEAGSASSNYISLYAFAPQDELVQAEVERQQAAVTEALEACEGRYAGDGGFVPPDSADNVLADLAQQIELLKDSGEVAYYEIDEYGAFVKLSCGVGVVYNPPIEGTNGYPEFEKASLCVCAYEPCSDITLESIFGEQKTMPVVVADFAGRDKLNSDASRYCKDAEVDLEAVKSIPSNSLVIWNGHGGYSSETGPTLYVGVSFDWGSFKSDRDYFEDLVCGAVVIRPMGTNLFALAITSSFIYKYYDNHGLQDDIVFSTSCHGAQDDRLANAFLSKNAKSFVGFTDTVYCRYADNIVLDTISEMCDSDITLAGALAKAKILHGENDRVWATYYWPTINVIEEIKSETAYPKIYGYDTYKLVSAIPVMPDVTVRLTLDSYSWEELKSISAAIAAAGSDAGGLAIAAKYNLVDAEGKLRGDTKSLTLSDGTETGVRILGFRHDDLESGGKAGISFEFADSPVAHAMNETDTNSGGWEASEMRSWLNSDEGFFGLLPSGLRSCIAPVSKRANNQGYVGSDGPSSVVTATADRLWLLSISEVYGELSGQPVNVPLLPEVYAAEGEQYKLYADQGVTAGNGVFCTKSGAATWWWLRSPDAVNTNIFLSVGSYNTWYSYNASAASGVSPGFCF